MASTMKRSSIMQDKVLESRENVSYTDRVYIKAEEPLHTYRMSFE
jgi:hypothetical protein